MKRKTWGYCKFICNRDRDKFDAVAVFRLSYLIFRVSMPTTSAAKHISSHADTHCHVPSQRPAFSYWLPQASSYRGDQRGRGASMPVTTWIGDPIRAVKFNPFRDIIQLLQHKWTFDSKTCLVRYFLWERQHVLLLHTSWAVSFDRAHTKEEWTDERKDLVHTYSRRILQVPIKGPIISRKHWGLGGLWDQKWVCRCTAGDSMEQLGQEQQCMVLEQKSMQTISHRRWA